MKAVILAGGMGTRLRPLTYHIPKPLVPLVDRPMVMHIIDSLPKEVDTVILAVSYMKDKLEAYFQENDCGRKVILVNEESPLGTGGALKNVSSYLDDTFFAFNGDVLTSLLSGSQAISVRATCCSVVGKSFGETHADASSY